MLALIFQFLPIALDLFKAFKGTPESKRAEFLQYVQKSTENFKLTGNTSDLGKL